MDSLVITIMSKNMSTTNLKLKKIIYELTKVLAMLMSTSFIVIEKLIRLLITLRRWPLLVEIKPISFLGNILIKRLKA